MFDQFQPDSAQEMKIPYFDDVSAADGWEGHTTSKSIQTLQAEISTNMAHLGCIVTGFASGTFGNRLGFRVHFAVKDANGGMYPSKMDIACLPLKPRRDNRGLRGGVDTRIEGTKKMALYMLNKGLKGMFFMNALIPGFIPFMSLMLDKKGSTLGEMWILNGGFKALQAPPKTDFEEEIIDVK